MCDGSLRVGQIDVDIIRAVWGTGFPIADLNGDSAVNVLDLLLVLATFGEVAADKLQGDINGDCSTDDVDLAVLKALWGTGNPTADLDGDGQVGSADLLILLEHFGDTCGTTILVGDIDGSCNVDETDLDLLLAVWGTDFPVADLNDDGTINILDHTLLLGNFGASCDDALLD